jgi:hypothetical protein
MMIMSLDVHLSVKGTAFMYEGSGIFIRENGQTKEISREEWDTRYPDREPVTFIPDDNDSDGMRTVFDGNITHNLNMMADAAGIYEHLWRPDEIGVTKAHQLIEPLTDGLAKLNSDPEKYKVHNPSNGWGSYTILVEFVAEYLAACRTYPNADVSVWR